MNVKKHARIILSHGVALSALLSTFFIISSCETDEHQCISPPNLTDIEGEYECSGECVITVNGEREVHIVSSEIDVIEGYPKSTKGIYQVKISGADDFHELEIGALQGRELYTATAEVSDSTYPVLEKYIFDTDEEGKVTGFTKIVRNPDQGNFKACVIYGKKKSK